MHLVQHVLYARQETIMFQEVSMEPFSIDVASILDPLFGTRGSKHIHRFCATEAL